MKYNIFPATSDFGIKVADHLLKTIDPKNLIMTTRSRKW